MIEFDGYITGKAEKFHQRKWRGSLRKIVLFSALVVLVPIASISFAYNAMIRLEISLSVFAVLFILTFLPVSKKKKRENTPYKIYTSGESIICVKKIQKVAHFIEDVVKVIDYGEFYYLTFPFGQISHDYVCQKSLLSKGTLEEFEALFEGKKEKRNL